MDVQGKIEVINDVQNISDSFWKRDFVINYQQPNSQYNDFLKFELLKDKSQLIDNFKVGDDVKVYFNLSGRKWTNPKGEEVYFNSLHAWKIEKVSDTQHHDEMSQVPPMDEEPEWLQSDNKKSDASDDNLPF